MKKLLTLTFLVLCYSHSAPADEVTYFANPSKYPDITTLLDTVGIGSTNTSSESPAISFKVPGTGSADVQFNMRKDTGLFNFNFGFFKRSVVQSIDPIANPQGWATAGLASAQEVFNDLTDNPGATKTVSLTGGEELIFYLIPNNTLAAFNADPSAFYPSQTSDHSHRSPLFSWTAANPAQKDQMMSFNGNNATLFTFEDLTRSEGFGSFPKSDEDFSDLAFSLDVELHPVPVSGPEPSSIAMIGLAAIGLAVRRRRKRVR